VTGIPIGPDGRFSGYASLFGQLDGGGDIVMPGAFGKSISRRRGRIRMLFGHDPKEPVGVWEAIGEDGRGLFVSGRLSDGVARADDLRRLIEAGALDGLSIDFRTVRATRDGGTGHRRLHEIELFEISIVTFPMLEEARIAPFLSAGAAIAAATNLIRN
jgi:HK97 family phage prohead protease